MSKRTRSIREMFAAPETDAPVDAKPASRVNSGAVRALKSTFSDAERQYEALREQLAQGAIVVELDPNLVDPSPFADRFEDQDPLAFTALKESIAERGQEIPILVREHPGSAGRYQSAYGHRRVRATRALGIPVKAYVREMSDEDLAVAQGIENFREELSYIERASFAFTLEGVGFKRSLVQAALAVDRAEVSKLVAVAKAVPADIQRAIGRAPKVGRPRWIALADAIADPAALARVKVAVESESFRQAHTNDRLSILLTAAQNKETQTSRPQPKNICSEDGAEIARVVQTVKHSRIEIDRQKDGEFAAFLVDKIPDLYRLYINEAQGEPKDE